MLLAAAPSALFPKAEFPLWSWHQLNTAGAKFKLQLMLFVQEQIQKQLEHLKALRRSGEEQRSEGDKNTANYLVRQRVFYGQSLLRFTPAGGRDRG